MRRFAGTGDAEVIAALAELETQHRVIERVHARFDALVLDPNRDLVELDRAAEALVTLYGPHIQLENDVIFPAASRLLPSDELLALGQEMRERRKDWLG